MADSRNWRELIDDLFAWQQDKQRRATERRPLEPDDLLNAPYEFQVYSVERYLWTTNTYSFTFNDYFTHLIDTIPEKYLPQIAELAVIATENDASPETVSNVIGQISEQQVEALHPFLNRLFDSIMAKDSHSHVRSAWRGAIDFAKLHTVLKDDQSSATAKLSAWECLLESRNPDAIRYAIDEAAHIHHWAGLEGYLLYVGFDWDGSTLRRLYSNVTYHLIFPKEYLKHRQPYELVHPTYHLNTPHAHKLAFGGVTENTCWVCHNPLHHVITVTPKLTGLPIHSRQHVELVTCLSCPDWETEGFYYHHDESGKAESIPHGQPSRKYHWNSPGFMPTEVALVLTPPRWQWQDSTRSRPNLFRLGGNPCWGIQYSGEYLNCPDCGQRMVFLMQLMDNLPDANGNPQAWGDTGMGYFFWCDRCAISGFVSVTL